MAQAFSILSAPSSVGVIFGFEHILRSVMRGSREVQAKIRPGELYVSRMDEEIVTVLGSCIAVCARDPEAGVGGMNHFLLPESKRAEQSASNRYGVWAMEMLLNSLLKSGASRERLEIKVTGGGQIGGSCSSVSLNNIDFIDKFLALEGFQAKARDVGGPHPRKVFYHPLSGRLVVHKLPPLKNSVVDLEETKLSRRISSQPRYGTVELFGSTEE